MRQDDNNRIGDTKRVVYARKFLSFFKEEFAGLDEVNQTFTITRLQFAEFLFRNEWLPQGWTSIPTKSEPERWAYMRSIMNRIRAEMNAASRLGLHGEPPFDATAGKGRVGNIIIHNLESMAVVTYEGVGKALRTYVRNKASDHQKRHAFLMEPENFDQLPTHLQSNLSGLEFTFRMITTTATNMLDSYMKQASEMHKKAHKILQIENDR